MRTMKFGNLSRTKDSDLRDSVRRLVDKSADRPAPWMLPEQQLEPDLAVRANQFAVWLDELEPAQQQMASVVTYAALAWMHQACRGLRSFLLVPSEAHLDLLGALTGLVPIEVGRGPKKQLGAPRLMRSSYWKPEQFLRHGRIVAAVEDAGHRISPDLPVLVHHLPSGPLPSPPLSITSLLAYSCLGSRTPAEAATKLAGLVESPGLQSAFNHQLEIGAHYHVTPGHYLDRFLEAVERHVGLENAVSRHHERHIMKREVVTRLQTQHGYAFSDTRLIDELRKATGFPQPARFGKDQIPVFNLPRSWITDDPAAAPASATASDHPQSSPPVSCGSSASG
jgi:hypothetical protein